MFLRRLSLQNFRNYSKSEFNFSKNTTLIVGPNTVGKTNLVEAIYLLSLGTSFHAEKDFQMIKFGEEVAHVQGNVDRFEPDSKETEQIELGVILTGEIVGKNAPQKKYLVNKVSKRRVDFSGNLITVLFNPEDLEIIVSAPSLRRKFLDSVLEQVDRDYRLALSSYAKGLRQRNALLENAREAGYRNEKLFEYWDNLLIENGGVIAKKRQEFIDFANSTQKDLFDFVAFYDQSVISKERLLQYKEAETGAGVTLVGPHRDDFNIHMFNNVRRVTHDIKLYGSRGQQRLVILQLKVLELLFIEKNLGIRPVLLLDDIFSELDESHIKLVLEMLGKQQSIITATHREFIGNKLLKDMVVIELELKK